MHSESPSNLFSLIHSMNKGEKRYFKLYARSRAPHISSMNHLLLFDTIEKQKKYEEGKIINQSIVQKKHLRMLKHYLHNLIMESLRTLRSKTNDIENKLSNLMENARIMRDKGFEREELKFLDKVQHLALKHERWGTAMTALFRKRKIIGRKESAEQWEKTDNEIEQLMNKLNNLTAYRTIGREVQLIINRSAVSRNIQIKFLKKLIDSNPLNDENKCLSTEAKIMHYFTLYNYYSFFEEHKHSYKVLSQTMQLMESNLEIIENADVEYAVVLNNIIVAQFQQEKYQEAFDNIQKFRSLARKPGKVQAIALLYSSICETHYYLHTGEFEEGAAILKNIEKELEVVNPVFPLQLNFLYYNIACVYFGAGSYRKSLLWVNKITSQSKIIFREDMQAFARILQILIYYEMKSTDILEHQIVSAYRFLLKRKQLFKVEESMLDFIRRLSKINPSQKIILDEFRKFRNKLVQITKDPKEKKALEYFDLISWLESKIENKPFAEIIKLRHRKDSLSRIQKINKRNK